MVALLPDKGKPSRAGMARLGERTRLVAKRVVNLRFAEA
jgi:hypothetical protein